MATRMHDPHAEVKQIINTNTINMSDKLEATGTIKEILPVENGTSKAGKEWKKQNFVIDTNAEYNPLICFQVFGDEKVENLTKYNKVGDTVTVSFNLSSRAWEKDGKTSYFTSADAWKISKVDNNKPSTTLDEEDSGLPF